MLPRHDVVEPVFGARQAKADCYADDDDPGATAGSAGCGDRRSVICAAHEAATG